ncbi:MAG: hypothetical protein Q9195_002139 [Heterodermia aff. obscurata]
MQKSGLPIPHDFLDEEDYVNSLLNFATSHDLFQKLCGGVHILDFLTQEPDLYSTLFPLEWRDWFEMHEIQDILALLMEKDLDGFFNQNCLDPVLVHGQSHNSVANNEQGTWRGKAMPPASLVEYVHSIRKHTLDRHIRPSNEKRNIASIKANGLARSVAVGMKPKKVHEVGNFVAYIDGLTHKISSCLGHEISHVVDVGSGQNYLGRALASPPHCKNVVAIESKHHNIDGAKTMDVTARLAKKEKIMRNKKIFRMSAVGNQNPVHSTGTNGVSGLPLEQVEHEHGAEQQPGRHGSIQYIESVVRSGDLSTIIPQIQQFQILGRSSCDPQLLVISLHSCGNLLHHGLRSLVLNPSVKAVAMVGCCYNLVTERLGPPTYKLPSLRSPNIRLEETSTACDPHGFPMSNRLAIYPHQCGEGVRLNITARMMAVQAPRNWTPKDSDAFFTRHFYRALLQKIFLDRGVVGAKANEKESAMSPSPKGWTGAGQAIILGSLRKSCYHSFTAYVRGAVEKLESDTVLGPKIVESMDGLTDSDITRYELNYGHKKKELSIVWSLMAFSAGVVESIIVVDRWLYLKEHDEVGECWVEAIFDYQQSPRNLVVVGIKK